jgi:sarcosine oxidase
LNPSTLKEGWSALNWDVIVIGVGGMGSASAYHLAARGVRVLGIEQHNIPHELGASHGINRIIRMAYAEDSRYVPMVQRSYQLWRKLGTRVRERLIFVTGGIDAGPEDSWIVQGSLKACAEHKLQYNLMTSAELRKRYPGFCLPESMVAIYQPQGGFVLSERSILAHTSLAVDLGAEIHECEQVLDWSVKRGVVTVRTERGSYQAPRLVITAGPWAADVINRLKGIVKPERQVLLWVQPLRRELFQIDTFPVFYLQDGDSKFYGLPEYGIPGFKIGKYNHLKQQVHPSTMDRECHDEDEQVLREGIRKFFPYADGPTILMKTCIFSNTPDENFILDLHPDFPEVSIAVGFSGHGFKFCPVVGEIMADFALEGGSKSFDLSLFKINRLLP